MLREWRDDYTLILTSHFSRINACLVSQLNAYITMFFIGFFEFSVYILMIIAMSEIIASPNMHFNTSQIEWNNDECSLYHKSHLNTCHKLSQHLLPFAATLMSLGTFFCCFLCKPPYGLIIGGCLRYPFLICLLIYTYYMHGVYAYFVERDCIISPITNKDNLVFRFNEIESYLHRLCIYYTLISFFMIPSLLFVYFLFFYLFQCIHKTYTKISLFCTLRRIADHSTQNNAYSNKKERYNLVEKVVSNCPICMQSDIEIILTKGCKHGCCKECLYKYLETDLKNIGNYPFKCFMNDCNILLNYTNVEYVLADNNKMLEEYDKYLIMSSTNGNNESIACPMCNAVMLKPRNIADQGLMQCVNTNCQTDLCSKCGVLWHMNQSCEEYQAQIKEKTSGADKAFDELSKAKKWCKCPNCGLVVERTEGCYHMTHHGCPYGENKRTDFCYFCGEILMKKTGEGWRFSKKTETKHFENGVYEKCINADKEESIELRISNGTGMNYDEMFL